MTTTIDLEAFDRCTDPVLRMLTVEQARGIVAYRGDDAIQERIEVLASKANEGALTPEERAEYEGYIRANKFLAILQAKARRLLAADRP